MRIPFVSRMLRITAAIVLLGGLTATVALSTMGFVDHIESADAAVVPGNTVNQNGTPSSRLQGRLDAALVIFQAGRCKVIVVSGATGIEGIDESEVMKNYLVKNGVPSDRIIQDSHGVNTAATAKNTAVALHLRGYSTVLAVSQFFHVPRLRLLLAAQGLNVVGNSHAQYFELRDIYSTLREVVAMGVLIVGPKLPVRAK